MDACSCGRTTKPIPRTERCGSEGSTITRTWSPDRQRVDADRGVPIDRSPRRCRPNRDRVYQAGVRGWPELQAGIAGARRAGPVYTMANMHGFFRQSAGPGWALAGDAGHSKTPHPDRESPALRQSEAVAAAIERALDGGHGTPDDVLRAWWRWRDQDGWEMYWLAHDLGAPGPTSPLLREVQRRVAADRDLTSALVRIFTHELRPSELITPTPSTSSDAAAPPAEHQEPARRASQWRAVKAGVAPRPLRHACDIAGRRSRNKRAPCPPGMPPVGERCASDASAGVRSCPGLTCNARGKHVCD
jgi:hypothetical protein